MCLQNSSLDFLFLTQLDSESVHTAVWDDSQDHHDAPIDIEAYEQIDLPFDGPPAETEAMEPMTGGQLLAYLKIYQNCVLFLLVCKFCSMGLCEKN